MPAKALRTEFSISLQASTGNSSLSWRAQDRRGNFQACSMSSSQMAALRTSLPARTTRCH